jgi:hypothetical protein
MRFENFWRLVSVVRPNELDGTGEERGLVEIRMVKGVYLLTECSHRNELFSKYLLSGTNVSFQCM